MKKILVLSDIHNSAGNAAQIIEDNADAGVIIFLGDGEDRFERALEMSGISICGDKAHEIYQVAGNCDWDSTAAMLICAEVSGHRICIAHGHAYRVKARSGIDGYALKAAEKGCDIALFGHTHSRLLETQGEVTLFNPGAVQNGSYGVITIDGDNVTFEHRYV